MLHIDVKTVYDWQSKVLLGHDSQFDKDGVSAGWLDVINHQLKKRKITTPNVDSISIPVSPINEIFVSKQQALLVQDLIKDFYDIIGHRTNATNTPNTIKIVWVQPISDHLIQRYNPYISRLPPKWSIFKTKLKFANTDDFETIKGLNYWLASIGVPNRANRATTLLKQRTYSQRFKKGSLDVMRDIDESMIYQDIISNLGREFKPLLKRSLVRERKKSKESFISDLAFMPIFKKFGFIYVFEYELSNEMEQYFYPFTSNNSGS